MFYIRILALILMSSSIAVIIAAVANARTFGAQLPDSGVTVKRMSLKERLEVLLYQAQANITPAEFIITSLIIGLALGAIFYFVTRGILIALICLIGGFFVYYLFLDSQREKLQWQYEEVQPQVYSSFLTGLDAYQNRLDEAVKLLAEKGPPIVRADWQEISAALTGARTDRDRIEKVVNHRSSNSFALLAALIIEYRADIDRLKLILKGSATTTGMVRQVIEDVDILKENRSYIIQPRNNLLIFLLMVPGMVIFVSLFMTGTGGFYSTFLGQILMFAGFGAALAIYLWTNRAIEKSLRTRAFHFIVPESRAKVVHQDDDAFVTIESGTTGRSRVERPDFDPTDLRLDEEMRDND
jgi:hypothetical protein